MKNILITGAYGFVGTNVVKGISNNIDYFKISLDTHEGNNFFYNKYYSWDNIDAIDMDSVNTVIHLAGKAHDTHNSTNPQLYYEANCGLTKIIFDKFLNSKIKKFIYFSSVKAVADTVEGKVLTEEYPPNPSTVYGKSKLQAEQYILKQTIPFGKKVYILRPCMIHGPGNKGNLNLLYSLVSKGIPYPLGLFDNKRSFMSIQNLIFILHEMIERPIESGIYNICDDEPVSTNDLIKIIAESLNNRPRIWRVSKKLIQAIAKYGDMLNLPLNTERLKKLTETYVVSNNKLKSVLGLQSLPVSASDGLLYTFKSFVK